MTTTPEPPSADPKKSQRPDGASPFTPIAPIRKPAFVPEPENNENPFVALSPHVTHVDAPQKKIPPLSPKAAVPPPATATPGPVDPARKQAAHFLLEDVSISLAPEFVPQPVAAPKNTVMDFSLDYTNPEAAPRSAPPPQNRVCTRCSRSSMTTVLFNGDHGPLCLKCYNPYCQHLVSNIFSDGEGPVFFRLYVAAVHFIAAWLVPVVPAIIWHRVFVQTGFGTAFEDWAVFAVAPTFGMAGFIILLLAGTFLIPAGQASVSLAGTPAGSFAQINPAYLLTLIKSALPGYLGVYSALVFSLLLNLAALALVSAFGGAWTGSVLVLPVSLCMSAIEMSLARYFLRGRRAPAGARRDKKNDPLFLTGRTEGRP
jgi:hypothetical protein